MPRAMHAPWTPWLYHDMPPAPPAARPARRASMSSHAAIPRRALQSRAPVSRYRSRPRRPASRGRTSYHKIMSLARSKATVGRDSPGAGSAGVNIYLRPPVARMSRYHPRNKSGPLLGARRLVVAGEMVELETERAGGSAVLAAEAGKRASVSSFRLSSRVNVRDMARIRETF